MMMRLISKLTKVAHLNSEKIALITENNQLTFQDLLNLLHACDLQLRARGLREGATVILNTDKAEFYIVFAFLASHRGLNIIFSGIDAVNQSGIEFDYYISTSEVAGIPDEKKLIIEGDWFSAMDTAVLPDFSSDEPPTASYTFVSSGSTGVPKFIRQTELSRLEDMASNERLRESPDKSTRYLSSLSVTMSWAMFGNIAAILAGGSAVILGEDRDKLLQYIDLYQVNNIITTPAVLGRIADFKGANQFLSAVKVLRAGGAYTSNALLDKFTKVFDGVLMVGYGASEIGGICQMNYADFANKADGCIGKIFRDDIEVAFFDDDLTLLPDANEGIVGFRQASSIVDSSYLVAQDSDAKTGFIKGYFFPGDIMRREGDWLFITGRVKNIINFSGNKISLEAIQTALEALVPNGLLACVAQPDEIGLEQLHVFYDGLDVISMDDVNSVLKEKIGALTVKEIRNVARLPLTPSGKLDMEKLRNTAKTKK